MKKTTAFATIPPPSMNPIMLIGLVRACIPLRGRIRVSLLRELVPELNACLAETQRADQRQYEDKEREALAPAA